MRTLLASSICLVFTLSLAGPLVAQTDPFAGTWKLNVTKSKFVPGPPLKSETRIYESGPKGMRVSVQRVPADGTTQEFEYTTNLDDKSYPITGSGPYGADAIADNLTSSNSIRSTLTRGGKAVATSTLTVSPDGKVLTVATKGKDRNGKPFNEVAVYDRQ